MDAQVVKAVASKTKSAQTSKRATSSTSQRTKELASGLHHETFGERRLLAAVLGRAIRDILSCRGDEADPRRRHAEDAWDWLQAEGEDSALTCFANLCDELGLVPKRVLQAIRALEARGENVSSDLLSARIPIRK